MASFIPDVIAESNRISQRHLHSTQLQWLEVMNDGVLTPYRPGWDFQEDWLSVELFPVYQKAGHCYQDSSLAG